MIDTMIVEDMVRNSEANNNIEKVRLEILKVYNIGEGSSNDEYGGRPRDQQPPTKQASVGPVRLEAPIGGTTDDEVDSPFG